MFEGKRLLNKAIQPLPSIVVCLAISALLVLQPGVAFADGQGDWNSVIAQGASERRQGNLNLSIELLSAARQSADSADIRAKASGELGASLLQARRYDQAEAPLLEAYSLLSGRERARYAIDLGNLASYRKHIDEARRYYREAVELTDGDAAVVVSTELNLARVDTEAYKLPLLAAISPKIEAIADVDLRARYHLNLGNQARPLGSEALELAYRNLEQSRALALQTTDRRLQVETLDALAQLYEDNGRRRDSLLLTQNALALAGNLEPGVAGDLLVSLEWRLGRLFNATGNDDLALAAYQRAVNNIEAIRQDIPIEYEDGRSSFRALLEPVYLGLTELLFRKASTLPPTARAAYLYRARDVIEMIKQSELQDYLGDRCEVEAIHGDNRAAVTPGVAVLYSIILPRSTELLLETDAGVSWRSAKVGEIVVRRVAKAFAKDLRNGSADYLERAQQLYQWLLAPFEDVYADQHIHTLIVVPDGGLRLVSMSALHDGKQFAIEKFAIATVTGMTMTNSDPPSGRAFVSLVAGMSEPGPVVEKLSSGTIAGLLGADITDTDSPRGLADTRTMRDPHLRARDSSGAQGNDGFKRASELRERLALPGVKKEIQALGQILHGDILLNAGFTVGNFQRAAETGEYRIVHVATHGVFGGSAEASYIMAYDDLLTMRGLQSLLKSEQFRKNPIELLSLSACETAEGDERSPLGISGAAIKARARSVLGTLWPVEDNAARMVMENFYLTLTNAHSSKVRALQQAQIELLRKPDFAHPFFWAPFVLIGNWL